MSASPFRFRCTCCGEYHVGMPSFGWDAPLPFVRLPAEQRNARAELHPDYCIIDGHEYYVRGCLEIPVHDEDEPLSWGAWVSLSRESFIQYVALHDDVGREAGARFVGWLCSAIPDYPADEPLKAAIHIRPWPARPFIELEPTDHPLAVEQRSGISVDRVRAIAERLLHSSDGSN